MRSHLLWGIVVAVLVSGAKARADAPNLNDPDGAGLRDREVLLDGPVDETRYQRGAVLGTLVLHFGLGHLVQGRYLQMGWKITAAEASSCLILGVGAALMKSYDSKPGNAPVGAVMLVSGIVLAASSLVWEIVDLWLGPLIQNEDYRNAERRLFHTTRGAALLPLAFSTTGAAVPGMTVALGF